MSTIEDHSLFIAIVNEGNFSRAADELAMSLPAVSRHLKRIEETLGTKLLNRTTRSLSLTQAGKIYYESCRRIEEETRTTRARLQDLTAKPVGSLKITATPAFSHALLIDALADFSQTYPDIQYQLEISDGQIDLVESGMDLAIRIGELQDSRLKSRLLTRSELVPCASPSYLEKHGIPELSTLKSHQFIYMSHLPSLERRHQQLMPELVIDEQQKKLVLNDVLSIHKAVRAGFGVTMLPRYLIEEDLASGQLIALFGGKFDSTHEIYVVFPSGDFMPLKTRAFIDFLVERFEGAD